MATALSWMWASLGLGAWLGLSLVSSLWFILVGVGTAVVIRLRAWPVWTAAVWTAAEDLRASWPWGGVPWGRLAYATPDTPWEPALPWLGATGTTFLLALLGSALAGLAIHVRAGMAQMGAYAAVLVGVSVLTVIFAVAGPVGTSTDASVRVAVVQGGVPGSGTRVVDNHREITANHLAETKRLASGAQWSAAPPAFVLWPENATAVDPTRDVVARTAVADAVASAGVPVIVGGVTDGPTSSTARNQLIVWNPAGPGPRYTKQHLVPFGEYVPVRGLATRVSQRVAEIGRDMVPGGGAAPLPVAGLRLATALCFDVAYDDVIADQVRQGSDLVTVSTSNAMFVGTAQLDQQWIVSRVRALETGRSVVVASINGISGAVGPDGTVRTTLPERVTASQIVEVPLGDGLTPAVRLGPWPGRLVSVLAVAAVVSGALAKGRTIRARHQPTSTMLNSN